MHKGIMLAAILAGSAAQAQEAEPSIGPFDQLHIMFCGASAGAEARTLIWRDTDEGIEGFGYLRGARFETQGSTLRIWVPQFRTTWEVDTRTGLGGTLQAAVARSVACVVGTDDVRMIAAELLGQP